MLKSIPLLHYLAAAMEEQSKPKLLATQEKYGEGVQIPT